jgi:hypothetical protein
MMPSQARSSSFIIGITHVQSVLVPEHFDYARNFGSIIGHNLINLTNGVIFVEFSIFKSDNYFLMISKQSFMSLLS